MVFINKISSIQEFGCAAAVTARQSALCLLFRSDGYHLYGVGVARFAAYIAGGNYYAVAFFQAERAYRYLFGVIE